MNDLPLNEARILAIDDEETNLRLVERLLKSVGYRGVETTADPVNGLSRIENESFDLILLDLNMPRLDGYEVMRRIRETTFAIPPAVLVLTAQGARDFMLRSLELGARDFVSKPFDRNELLMRVRNLLEAQLAQRLLQDQKTTLESLVANRTRELSNTRLQVVQRLGRAAEYRDEDTGQHIMRMSRISARLATEIGWSDRQVELMLHASPMHDIGKIGIPDAILRKPGRLTAEEWHTMKTHTTIGAELLAGDESDLMTLAREIALSHHEKWDGSGYPNRLGSEDIPLSGRICGLADVFDALTSERPYKKPWPVEKAIDLIREARGKHFDPLIVDAFLDVIDDIEQIRQDHQERPDHPVTFS
ncbi:HD domain-containing phosphohydrolase [Guyparkeria sp.]|uniref:HD domain-containing phosphohydrolase n=1 Tax=Guyparkeria sp. TaxID=2035736 RepID=UPI003970FDDF